MNGKVEQVGAIKFNKNGVPYFTVKIGRDWYSISGDQGDQEKLASKPMVSYTVTKEKQGTYNAWIKVDAVEDPVVERVNPVEAPIGSNVFRLPTWDDYASIMRRAHDVARELEPDALPDGDVPIIDRSSARAAIVNTIIIAFSKGSIALPEDESPF